MVYSTFSIHLKLLPCDTPMRHKRPRIATTRYVSVSITLFRSMFPGSCLSPQPEPYAQNMYDQHHALVVFRAIVFDQKSTLSILT